MKPAGRQGAIRAGGSLPGFDGLRAIAALTVLSYHVALRDGLTQAHWFAPALWELKAGVAIFFVISGALLYLPYARALSDGRDLPDWRSYACRRAVRILPAYWVAVTAVGVAPLHAGVFGPNAWRYYGLSQIYAPQTLLGGVGVAWSLCVEVTFYLALPLIAASAARLARRRSVGGAAGGQLALIAAIGVGSLALRGALGGSLTAPASGVIAVTLPGMLDWFAIGMSLAVLRATLEAGGAVIGPIGHLARRRGRCLLLAVAAFLAALVTQGSDAFLPWYGLVPHLAIGVGCGLLVLAVMIPDPGGRRAGPLRVLDHPLLAWVGVVSYGVYLWQLPALELIAPHLLPPAPSGSLDQAALTWLAVTAASLLLGAASWYLIERPAQRFSASRSRARKGQEAPGRVCDTDSGVHSTLDPLNSSGVAVDHLA